MDVYVFKQKGGLDELRKIGYNLSMKKAIHPTYYENATVICSCGNRFNTGSTQEIIHVEICGKCHPFYTGEQKFLDTASRIKKFQQKQAAGQNYVSKKTKKEEKKKEEDKGPKTLREMLMSVK